MIIFQHILASAALLLLTNTEIRVVVPTVGDILITKLDGALELLADLAFFNCMYVGHTSSHSPELPLNLELLGELLGGLVKV